MKLFSRKPDMVLTIPSMSCGHCEKKITEILSKVEGVTSVTADSRKKEVKVYGKTAFDTIKHALSSTSYTPSLKEPHHDE